MPENNCCLFFQGTFSTKNPKPIAYVPSSIHSFMYTPNNVLEQLYDNTIGPKYFFNGVGAELCNKSAEKLFGIIYKLMSSISGGVYGNWGINNYATNLNRASNAIKDKAMHTNGILSLHIYSWSRGGYIAWLLKDVIKKLLASGILKDIKLFFYNIDPVPGLFDRFHLYLSEKHTLKCSAISYHSDTGNVDLWDKYISEQNIPGYSGLYISEGESHLLRANHQDLVGASINSHADDPKRWVAEVVLADFAIASAQRGIRYHEEWLRKTLAAGEIALQKYLESGLVPKKDRKFIDPTHNSFFGRKITKLNLKVVDQFSQLLSKRLAKPEQMELRSRL